MSEYSQKHSAETREEVAERCFEARCEADWWASRHPHATPKEVIAEGERRYFSFYERSHFILEVAEVIEIMKKKEKMMNNDIFGQHDKTVEREIQPPGTEGYPRQDTG